MAAVSYSRAEAKDPQPEIRLRADRRVSYDFVAKVLPAALHDRMKKMAPERAAWTWDVRAQARCLTHN